MTNYQWAAINFVIFLFFLGLSVAKEMTPLAAIPSGLVTIFFIAMSSK